MRIIAVVVSLFTVSSVVSCSLIPPMHFEPEEAKTVSVYTVDKGLPDKCKSLGEVEGIGSDEREATYDLQYNAATQLLANAVLVHRIDEFYQNKRLHNYAREPELMARKGTKNYKYIFPFKFRAKAMAVMCP